MVKLTLSFLCVLNRATATNTATNPIEEVLQLVQNLQATIIKEGESSQKVYEEFAEWCETRAKELSFEIKDGKSEVAELQATIDKMNADIEAHTSKIEGLAADDSGASEELASATKMRGKESQDFAAENQDLTETVDMIERAIVILEKQNVGASLSQVHSAESLTQVLQTMVQASSLNTNDALKLTALVQSKSRSDSDDEDSDDASVAPATAAYEGKSGTVVSVLEDLLDKAETQLGAARKAETTAKHNFELKKQSLEDSMKFSGSEMSETKSKLAACEETKASAGGELTATKKDLAEDNTNLEGIRQDCMSKAQDFEAEVKSRDEELTALAEAKKIVKDSTGGAAAYAQVSFLQESDSAVTIRALKAVKETAQKQHSSLLAQLSARMSSALRLASASHVDPFEKVRGMISDMLSKLEAAAEADSDHKAWCDKQMDETLAKKEDKEAKIEKASTKAEQKTSRSAQLKEEVTVLQKELAALLRTQAEMEKIRQEEKSLFNANKVELEEGLSGVKKALKVLRDYYAKDDADHKTSSGGASGIIGLLEVVESDFSKNLAEAIASEDSAVGEFTKESNENALTKTQKQQDVKYKTGEAASLDKALADIKDDLDGAQQELDAINEFLIGIKGRCSGKVESYEERKSHRDAEIAGLKDALQILESETALIQRSVVHRHLRTRA